MFTHFDLHANSRRLAVRKADLQGSVYLELRIAQGEIAGEINNAFLPNAPRWSPDGSRIAFGSNDGLLYVYTVGDAAPEIVFQRESLQAGFPEWSPGGGSLAFSAWRRTSHDPPNIHLLDLRTGLTTQLTDDDNAVDRFPVWSPSGHWVAFQRQYLDEPDRPPWVCVVDVEFKNCRAVGRGELQRFGWSPDSSLLLIKDGQGDSTHLRAVRIGDSVEVWIHESALLIHGGAFSASGESVLRIREDDLTWVAFPAGGLNDCLPLSAPVAGYFTGPNISLGTEDAVYFLDEGSSINRWQTGGQVATVLRDEPEPKPSFLHEEYSVVSGDGLSVPVQRFIPPNAKAPAVLYVHGGPGAPINPDDATMLHRLGEGYEFICAAYRGSAGYGAKHRNANRGEYGRTDVRDVVACAQDWKERTGGSRPLVLAGYSYGGFLGLLALSRAEALLAGGIIMWPVTGLHRFPSHTHRALPEGCAERHQALTERSLVERASHIRVPVLIFHGALDTAGNAEELSVIQQRIQAAGGDCSLKVFDDDTHALRRHLDEIHADMLRFLGRFE